MLPDFMSRIMKRNGWSALKTIGRRLHSHRCCRGHYGGGRGSSLGAGLIHVDECLVNGGGDFQPGIGGHSGEIGLIGECLGHSHRGQGPAELELPGQGEARQAEIHSVLEMEILHPLARAVSVKDCSSAGRPSICLGRRITMERSSPW